MIRKLMLAGAVFGFVACSGEGGTTDPPKVTTVTVTLNPTQITVNGTSQASVVVKDQFGAGMSGQTASWLSLTPTVASVTSAGVVTGVSAGTAVIQATVAGVTGSATIQVIAAVSVCNTGLTVVDLAPGGVRMLSSTSTQGCIKVPAATSAAADYLVIPANLNSAPDVFGQFTFKSDEGEVVPGNQFLANSISGTDAFGAASVSDFGARQISFENRLRLAERRDLSMSAAQAAYRDRDKAGALRYEQSVAIPAIGDHTTFRVPSQDHPCSQFTTITAEVKFINDKTIIYSDITSPAGGFTGTDYQQIGDEFANLIYPTDVAYFGTPLDDDKNGRVIILYTPEVNKLTPSGNPSSFVGGFFWAGDLVGTGDCAQSNTAELFYLLTPDPTGQFNGNIRNTTTVRQGTRGTIAHEFQHMINASNRIASPIEQEFEDSWLDEGLSHFAEDAVGRVVRGIEEAEDATFSRTLGGSADDFNAFFNQNFVRFSLYLKNPGAFSPTSLQTDAVPDTGIAVRGAAWALVRYAADQYAPGGDVKAFTRKLAGGPDIGVQNLTKNASGVSYETLIGGFLIANYADNLGIPNLSPLYTYKVYNMRSVLPPLNLNGGSYPLKVNTITGTNYAASGQKVRSGSGVYFFITRPAGAPARTFRLLNPDGATAASFTGANWLLLRTR
ncbi:MAG TPA: Ig-like domain-containing protein [Gemmatimonadaceae bacterium]|nr:Ig-like domain-containing protein [Gemmatimonadaceae bacterium]